MIFSSILTDIRVVIAVADEPVLPNVDVVGPRGDADHVVVAVLGHVEHAALLLARGVVAAANAAPI